MKISSIAVFTFAPFLITAALAQGQLVNGKIISAINQSDYLKTNQCAFSGDPAKLIQTYYQTIAICTLLEGEEIDAHAVGTWDDVSVAFAQRVLGDKDVEKSRAAKYAIVKLCAEQFNSIRVSFSINKVSKTKATALGDVLAQWFIANGRLSLPWEGGENDMVEVSPVDFSNAIGQLSAELSINKHGLESVNSSTFTYRQFYTSMEAIYFAKHGKSILGKDDAGIFISKNGKKVHVLRVNVTTHGPTSSAQSVPNKK